mmetsp:Transcript_63187/g.111639  ORF Transcript_63187/g.111639 Transcript_63187/m.111639 type:complete len:264 (+) Transcript_63187:168-959(+)
MLRENGINAFHQKVGHLLGRAAHKLRRLEQLVQVGVHRCKERVLGDALEEIVSCAFFLHTASGGHAVLADRFVQNLSVAAGFDALHENHLGGHERQLQGNVLLDYRRPHMQAVGDIDQRGEDHIRREEGLRQGDTTNGRVVQSTLKPLIRMRVGGILWQRHEIARETADSLGAHGVALVGHRTRPDLVLAEWLLNLFHRSQQTNVRAHLVGRLRQTGESAQHLEIDLTGVGLSRDRHPLAKTHLFAHALVQLLYFVVIPIEQF